MELNRIYNETCLQTLQKMPDKFVNCVVTSPPYWGLRDYGHDDQIGLEETPEKYVAKLVDIFSEIHRVLTDDGTVWLNLGDSYAGSGKGGNPENGKQSTNKGSQSIGVLYGKTGESARKAAVTNVSRRFTNNHSILKPKDLVGIPWRVAFALQEFGWYLRQDIIWNKPNPMPESVTDRCTKAHEYIFFLTKSPKYYFDNNAIKEEATWTEKTPRESGMQRNGQKYRDKVKYGGGGTSFQGHSGNYKANGELINPDGKRNKRSVWEITTKPFAEAHFATFPIELPSLCILAGCPENGVVYDPFFGSGTTGEAALKYNRSFIGSEINPDYVKIAENRLAPHLQQISIFQLLNSAI